MDPADEAAPVQGEDRQTSTHPFDLERWAPAGDATFEILAPGSGRIVVPAGSIVIGREPAGRGIRIDAAGISREHAQVTRSLGRTTSIMDLGSKNGTFVNGRPVTVCTLRDGDRVCLGPHVELRFTYLVLDEPGTIRLTRREREVAELVAEGLTNRAIAERLGVTAHAIDAVLRSAFRRVGVDSRAGLAAWVVRNG